MNDQTRVDIDQVKFIEVVELLRLQTPEGNEAIRESLKPFAMESLTSPQRLMAGLSSSNIKNMRRRSAQVPSKLPWLLVYFFFRETGIDLTPKQSLAVFLSLGFDIQLSVDIESQNQEEHEIDRHKLINLDFRIDEARAVAEDPDDQNFELDLRIGFDRARLTIRGDRVRAFGNYVAGDLPLDPSAAATSDYEGWFEMKLASLQPLSWFFDPTIEGDVLRGRIFAEFLANIAAERGSTLNAEITASRDSLKVRVVDEAGQQRASKSLAEFHREKMCNAIARRSFIGSADEFVLFRTSLLKENRSES